MDVIPCDEQELDNNGNEEVGQDETAESLVQKYTYTDYEQAA